MFDESFNPDTSLPEDCGGEQSLFEESQTSSGAYRFENFEIDCMRRELRRNGLKIHLKGRPFTLLAILVESQGRIVTREELRGRLWPPDTYVDFDANLTTAFCKVRKALGDSSKESRFIETLPCQGYRFIEPVVSLRQESAGSAAVGASSEQVSTAGEERRDRSALEAQLGPKETSNSGSPRAESWINATNPTGRRWAAAAGVAVAAMLVVLFFGYRKVWSAHAASSTPQLVRLAVLPFNEVNNDADVDLFADGLHDSLITQLGASPKLAVICRTTSATYKKTNKSAEEIARELNVDYILEGSVQTGRLCALVSVRLVRASDQSELWAQSYDRPFQDPLALQAELANQIRAALPVQELFAHGTNADDHLAVSPCPESKTYPPTSPPQ